MVKVVIVGTGNFHHSNARAPWWWTKASFAGLFPCPSLLSSHRWTFFQDHLPQSSHIQTWKHLSLLPGEPDLGLYAQIFFKKMKFKCVIVFHCGVHALFPKNTWDWAPFHIDTGHLASSSLKNPNLFSLFY
jgi:hypothetical protein